MKAKASARPKLLVANRSEIACRVFQAARELGLSTVAICAPGDEEARHLTFAHEVMPVASYLDVPSILAVAQRSGATLIHPGYGFLSERAHFADAVEKAGLVFLGPTAKTMDLMGAKIASKEIAAKAGIPTLPWAKVTKFEHLKSAASKVGYPLLLKASAGGGGKGMRRVDHEKDLLAAAESASSEAQSSFGDGTLFLEKLVEAPRHIEVQVFGDGEGGGIHLRERECSLQRRHQKVWEEATAPHLPEKTRQGLFESAMNLVRAVKYRSAGTLEYLVDAEGGFYFLEMNTRLQVEHPVTELVTGVDLVHLQINLGLDPSSVQKLQFPEPRGHAIEVRLYAEDPAQSFMPTPGRVEKLIWPSGAGIRVDSGIEEGQTIGTGFDSMLGKLIVWAPTRTLAVARLVFALEETVILGLGTNQAYLLAIARHAAVREGKVHTGFLGSEFGDFKPELSAHEFALVAQLKASGLLRSSADPRNSTGYPSPWETIGRSNG